MIKWPETAEEIHIARNQLRLNSILRRIELETPSTSPNTHVINDTIEQPHFIDGEEWPVPTLFLEQHMGEFTTPMLGHAGDHSPAILIYPVQCSNSPARHTSPCGLSTTVMPTTLCTPRNICLSQLQKPLPPTLQNLSSP